jgi:hypothetical protein
MHSFFSNFPWKKNIGRKVKNCWTWHDVDSKFAWYRYNKNSWKPTRRHLSPLNLDIFSPSLFGTLMPNQTTGKIRTNPLHTTYFQTLVTPLFPLLMFPYFPMNIVLFQLFLTHNKVNIWWPLLKLHARIGKTTIKAFMNLWNIFVFN